MNRIVRTINNCGPCLWQVATPTTKAQQASAAFLRRLTISTLALALCLAITPA